MGVVIEICIKYSGGPTRMRVADILDYIIGVDPFSTPLYT